MRMILPLLILLLSCDILEPGNEVVKGDLHPIDFDKDGEYDAAIQTRYATFGLHPAYIHTLCTFEIGSGRSILVTEGRRSLAPGEIVGSAPTWNDFRNSGEYPYWGSFEHSLASIRYRNRDASIKDTIGIEDKPEFGTGPDGVYIGFKLAPDTGVGERYGWVRIKSNPVRVNGEWRIFTVMQGFALGKLGEPITVGEYPE